MSYVVLARKYRPRSFEQMVGQEHVVRALTNALEQQRLHHAYLFTGTRGIGKTTVSRILAKSLNCSGPDGTGGITARPCGVCTACTEIDADRYIDYIELDAASNRSIDEIRDLIERAAYKPGIGRFKVFMIDEAHQLTKDAFNALLKTLEEPPEYLKFVLATTDPEKMLPTVLSRCLQFNLRPMAPQTVREHLQTVLEAENVPFDEPSLRLLGRAAHGSMRDALSLADQAIAYGGGRVDEAVVRAMLGAVDRSHAQHLIAALARRDGPAVLATVDALRQAGLSGAATLEELATLLQQMAVEQAVPGALDATDPDTEAARSLAPQMPPDETQLLYSIAIHGREELSLMSDEYAALTMVLLRLLAFPSAGGAPRSAAPVPQGAQESAPARSASMAATAVASPTAAPPSAAPGAVPRPLAAASSSPATGSAAAASPASVSPAAATAASPSVARPNAPSPAPPSPMAQRPSSGSTPAWSKNAPAPVRSAPPTVAPSPSGGPRPETPRAAQPARPAPAGPAPQPDDEPEPYESYDSYDSYESTATVVRVPSIPPWEEDPGDPVSPMPTSGPPAAAHAAPAPRAAPLRAPTPPAITLPAPSEESVALSNRWYTVARRMAEAGRIVALTRELAWQAGLTGVDESAQPPVWRLRVESESLRAQALCDKLQTALSAELGMPVKLDVEAGTPDDSPLRRENGERARRQAEAEEIIRSDPVVVDLLAQFKTARIVPGSIKPVSPVSQVSQGRTEP